MVERYARPGQNGPYLVRDASTITMVDMSRAVSGREETLSKYQSCCRFGRPVQGTHNAEVFVNCP